MIAILIIVLVILSMLAYLLLAPVVLHIDTDEGVYRVRYHYLASAEAAYDERGPVLKYSLFGWRNTWVVFAPKQEKPKSKVAESKTKPVKNDIKAGWQGMSSKTILRMLKSCKICRSYIDLDIGDVVLSAQLYPLLAILGYYTGLNISLNFQGRQTVQLIVSNSLAKIGWIYLTNSINNKR